MSPCPGRSWSSTTCEKFRFSLYELLGPLTFTELGLMSIMQPERPEDEAIPARGD